MWKITHIFTEYVMSESEGQSLKEKYLDLIGNNSLRRSPIPFEFSDSSMLPGSVSVRYFHSRAEAELWVATAQNLVPGVASNSWTIEEVIE